MYVHIQHFLLNILWNKTFRSNFHNAKTRYLSYFGSYLMPLNTLSSIMAHVTNYGLLAEYLSSVYKFKRCYKYADVFENIMLNLITELFWNNK